VLWGYDASMPVYRRMLDLIGVVASPFLNDFDQARIQAKIWHVPVLRTGVISGMGAPFHVAPLYHPRLLSLLHNHLALNLSLPREGRMLLIRRSSSSNQGFVRHAYDNRSHIPRELTNAREFLSLHPDVYSFDPKEYSLKETQTLMSEASVLAGVHGAGFINMLYCPTSTRIVEMHPGSIRVFFHAMAVELNLPYFPLILKEASFHSPITISAREMLDLYECMSQ